MIRLIIIFIIIISSIWFSLGSDESYNTRRKAYINFIVFILALQSGLRHVGVGSDTPQYFNRWRIVKNSSWNDIFYSFSNPGAKDPFYGFFQKCLQVISEEYQILLLFIGFFFMIALGRFIKKNTSRISHAMLAFIIYMGYFYGFFSITGLRQTIATAFLLYSYEYVKKEKLIPFLLLVLTASLFHISALVFLPLYFLGKIKNTKLIFGGIILCFPFLMLFKNQLILLLLSTSSLNDRFAEYAQQYHRGGSLILTLFQIILAIYAIIIVKKVLNVKPIIYKMYNTFALALFFLPLQWVNPSAGRISQYFAIIIMVFIPHIIDVTAGESVNKRRGLYALVTMAFIFITLFSIQNFYGYHFFWQDMRVRFSH